MSSLPVYIGRWHDFSRGSGVLGDVVTLQVKWGGYLIAALSTFVGFVGGAAWTIVAFWIHQSRTKPGKADLLFAQQQVVYRNQDSAFTAAFDIAKLWWAWKKPRGGSARVEKLAWRSIVLSMPPLIIFLAFSIAALFVANVAGATYSGNDVLIAYNKCGFWQYSDTTIQGSAAFQAKITNDTLVGRSYSRNCYGTNASLAECGVFPVQSLPVQQSTVPCPFGDDPTGHHLCQFGNNEAVRLDTGLLDSSETFGINAPKSDRMLVRKLLTCSPIYIKNYFNTSADPNGNPINTYNLGSLPGQSYTWQYDVIAANAQIPYQIASFYDSLGSWAPVPALQVSTGDVSLYLLAQNSVIYFQPVNDILFAAHKTLSVGNGVISTFYRPDQYVNAMACVDQYQLCDPNTSPLRCTIEGSFKQLVKGTQEMSLTTEQTATAERLTSPLSRITTYGTVSALAAAPLLASDKLINGLEGSQLPDNQWQIEMTGWFTTSLAKLQSYVVEFAANVADLGPQGTVEIPGNANDPIIQALTATCTQQRIRNTGAYQTFSFLGLMVTICIGSAIILGSWILEPIVELIRHHRPNANRDYREVSRIADHMLQLQKMALMGADHTSGWDEETLLHNFPVTEAGARTEFPLPSRHDPHDKDYKYAVPERLMDGVVTAYEPPTDMQMNLDAESLRRSPMPQERFSQGGSSSHHSIGRPDMPGESASQQPLNRDYLRHTAGGSARDMRGSVSDFDGSY